MEGTCTAGEPGECNAEGAVDESRGHTSTPSDSRALCRVMAFITVASMPT